MGNKENKFIKVVNALKRSAIAEHLVNNNEFANFLKRFKIVEYCFNIFKLIKLEAICILIRKSKLCEHKNFYYTVFLFL